MSSSYIMIILSSMRILARDNLAILFVCLFAFVASIWLRERAVEMDVANKIMTPPPEYIEHMHFGFPYSMADSIWIRWIQDIDTCYTYIEPIKVIENPVSIESDPLVANPRNKVCDNSWAFTMLDAATKLDPKFEMPYLFGAGVLSVLVEDFTGASIIYDRAIENYPNNWEILYRAAYHFQFDKQDYVKAADLLNRAAAAGAPEWVRSLAARLYTRAGQLELGLSTLEAYRKMITDEEQAKPIDRRIRELRAELEKQGRE